jgi:hypothetical protein
MLYVGDNQFAAVHVFGFDGSYGGHVEEKKGFLISPSSFAMKPGKMAETWYQSSLQVNRYTN